MATKKQRRRQDKQRRHEWEEVWVDDEGHEVEPPPEAERSASRKADAVKARPAARNPRAAREVPAPSWQRVGKRGAIFVPLMFFVVFYLQKSPRHLGSAVYQTAFLMLFFIPFSYLMDRVMYRAYLKRTGKQPSPPPKKQS